MCLGARASDWQEVENERQGPARQNVQSNFVQQDATQRFRNKKCSSKKHEESGSAVVTGREGKGGTRTSLV